MMMKHKHVPSFGGLALLLAALLAFAAGHGQSAAAASQAGVRWTIHSELDNHTATSNGSAQEATEKTIQISSDGDDLNYVRTVQVNPDGSTHIHEEIVLSKQACNQDKLIRDTYIDVKGNRTVHMVETAQKGKKCYQYTSDYKIDSHNKQISSTGKVTEVPCDCGSPLKTPEPTPTPEETEKPPAQYTLEVHWEGNLTGDVTIQWGPDTNVIPLKLKENSTTVYEGSYQGENHATLSGDCTGSGSFPVSIEATAEGNNGELEFTVKTTMGGYAFDTCGSASGNYSAPASTKTDTFTLPVQDGASKTYQLNQYFSKTYTLRVGK